MSKRAISIPLPVWKCPPRSKRVRKDGTLCKTGFGQRDKNSNPIRGAFGKHATTLAKKAAFLAESGRQGNELTKERQLRQAYTKFFKTTDGRAFAKEFGKSIPSNHGAPRRGHSGGEDSLDFCDPANLPQASVIDHPVDHIEPAIPHDCPICQGWPCEHGITRTVTREEIKIATEVFELSMRWCVDGADLVSKGLRSSIVISIMRPDLQSGLKIDKAASKIFSRSHSGANGDMELSGRLFGPVLEWLRRGDKVSELGERIMVLFYVLRPDLIGESTLAALGRISNKTRQAKDKLANCLRDTYSGIKARAMRGDITRTRCRESQLAIS